MRKVGWIVAIAVAVVGVTAFLFLHEFDHGDAVEIAADAPSVATATPEPEALPAHTDVARSESVAEAAPVVAPSAPDSYRRALGGIVGRIVEPDGKPVPKLRVELLVASMEDFTSPMSAWFDTPPDFELVKGSTVTDDGGRFRFSEITCRAAQLLGLDLGGPRAKVRFVDRQPNSGEIVDLGDIPLDPYAIFTGTVLDEKKAPVPGARVRATNLPGVIFSFGVADVKPGFSVAFKDDMRGLWRVAPIPSWLSRIVERFPIPVTVTDAEGKFRLEGVPLGQATVLIDKNDFVTLVKTPVPTGPAGGEKDLGNLELSAGETLTGKVVDGDGNPIAKASVMAGPKLDMAPAGVLMPIAKTKEDGTFSARGLKDADHIVAARPEGAFDWTVVTDVTPGIDEPTIKIGEVHSLVVRVVAPSGATLKKPKLLVQPLSFAPMHPLIVPPLPLEKRITHREDGAVVVAGLEPREYVVLAKAEGHAVGRAQADLTKGPTEVVIQLEAESSQQFTVVTAGTHEPVEWALVGAYDPKSENRELRRVPVMSNRTTKDGTAMIGGLKPGSYKAQVAHPAFADSTVDFTVPGAPVVIEMFQGGSVKGKVREGGQPANPERFVSVFLPREEDFPHVRTTAADGTFEITHLVPGDYQGVVLRRFADKSLGEFAANLEGLMPEQMFNFTIVDGQATEVDIDLLGGDADGPTGTIRGRVVLNGAPGAGLPVSARPANDFRGRRAVETDDNGRFELQKVKAGEVIVEVRKSTSAGNLLFGRLATKTVTVTANETAEVDLDIRTGAIRGRVLVDNDGSPVVGAEVRLRADDPPPAQSAVDAAAEKARSALDGARRGPPPMMQAQGARMQTVSAADGSFEFEFVPSGKYRVDVRRDGLAGAGVGGIDVPYGGSPPPVIVRLIAGVDAKGTVELPADLANAPFAFVEFRAQGDSGARAGGGVRKDNKSFEVHGLVPGKYDVRVFVPEVQFETLQIDVPPNGLDGYVLRPQKKAPPPAR